MHARTHIHYSQKFLEAEKWGKGLRCRRTLSCNISVREHCPKDTETEVPGSGSCFRGLSTYECQEQSLDVQSSVRCMPSSHGGNCLWSQHLGDRHMQTPRARWMARLARTSDFWVPREIVSITKNRWKTPPYEHTCVLTYKHTYISNNV